METIIIAILIILLVPAAYASIIGAPTVLTNKSLIESIVKKANVKKKDTFYELGTGTGRVITAFAKQKNIEVVGFELSPIFYLITLLNLKLHGVKNYKLYFKNFLTADLKNADVIFCFLMPKTMEKMKNKFINELKPKTKIISFAFPIKDWTPCEILKGKDKPATYFYQIN